MNLLKFYVFIGLVILSTTTHSQNTFSKSFDIDDHTDNGVKVIQVDTLLITHSISRCNFPLNDVCTGIVCTNLLGELKWIRDLDTIRTNGNDGLIIYEDIIYVGAIDLGTINKPIRITSIDLEGNILASVSIENDLNFPAIRSILKIESGWLLNITEELSQNHRFASLIWLDENFNFLEKKTYSDLSYHFWVQELIDLGEDGFIAAGTYRTPEWSQEHSIIKIDTAGNVASSFRLPPPYASGLTSLAVADDGNLIVSYPLYDFTIFPDFDRPYTIQKVTPDGEVLWRHIFYNLGPQTIAEFIIAENGDIVGAGTDYVDNGETFDIYGHLFRMTQDGELLWQKAIADYRYAQLPISDFNNLTELDNGDLVMTGSIEDTVANFNPVPSNEILNTWLVRTDANGCLYESCEDITQVVPNRNLAEELNLFELWPTLTTNSAEIVPRGEVNGTSRWTMSVVNLAGQLLQSMEVRRFPYTLTVTDYPPGIYFVRLENRTGAFQMLKLVKM